MHWRHQPRLQPPAANLAPELQLQVFDSLAQSDVMCASRVCSGWRRAAISHPTYWKNVELVANGTTDYDVCTARTKLRFVASLLSRAPPDGMQNVSFRTTPGCPLLWGYLGSQETAAFCRGQLFRKSFLRIQKLVVRYSDIVLPVVMSALEAVGAPNLRHLELSTGYHLDRFVPKPNSRQAVMKFACWITNSRKTRLESPEIAFYNDRKGHPHVLPKMLHQHAPNLRSLRLHYVELPDTPNQVFQTVDVLWLVDCQGVVLSTLPRRFPHLLKLGFEARRDEHQPLGATQFTQVWLSRLEALYTDDHEMIQCVASTRMAPISRTTILSSSRSTYNSMIRLTAEWWNIPSRGSLVFRIVPFDGNFSGHYDDYAGHTFLLELFSLETGHAFGTQVFLGRLGIEEYIGRNPIYLAALRTVWPQVTALHIPASHIYQLLLELKALSLHQITEVELEVPSRRELRQYGKPVVRNAWPSLCFIKILGSRSCEQRGETWLSAGELAKSLDWMFGPPRSDTEIELVGDVWTAEAPQLRVMAFDELVNRFTPQIAS